MGVPGPGPLSADLETVLEHSAVIIAVVSPAALASPAFAAEAEVALRSSTQLVPVFLAEPDLTTAPPVFRRLWRLVRIAATDLSDEELWRQLEELLSPPTELAFDGDPLPWDVAAFSALLVGAEKRNDRSRMSALVDAFESHEVRPSPYPADAANRDLDELRKDREFLLMRRYASATGSSNLRVRRQLAQSLIELKEFDAAVEVLEGLVADARRRDTREAREERVEGLGLLGRCHKQRYVDAATERDGSWLVEAISHYLQSFDAEADDDKKDVWPGVNAASCLQRAYRDGVIAPPDRFAIDLAEKVLDILRRRDRGDGLDLWDCASLVEAQVVLGRYAEARVSLERYLAHPDMRAFEVSSTFRQFDEVLQLGASAAPPARELWKRLAGAAARTRVGGIDIDLASNRTRELLVQVSDPGWRPPVPELDVRARLGTTLSVSGSDRAIAALLKDPLVTSIEESMPGGSPECDQSMRFVGVAASYPGADGVVSGEDGGHALVAVIDVDFDVLHTAFRDDEGRSRIIGIWDQRNGDGSPPDNFTSGTFHSADDVQRYIDEGKVPTGLARGGLGHGTHVASIAVGRRSGLFAGGVAPGAQLLVVIVDDDGPAGYSASHLRALAFISETATTLNKPVVVNVSLGSNEGAHDGLSPVERAFDAFSDKGALPGRVVVKSAGNLRDRRGHAKLAVHHRSLEELRILGQPGEEAYLELWWDSADRYRFRLVPPTGQPSDWVAIGRPEAARHVKGHGRYRLQLDRSVPENGDSRLIVTFRNGYPNAATWTVEVEAMKVTASSQMHAWIKRDQRAQFLDHDDEEMTLSVPGTAFSVITVASVAAGFPLRVARTSSYGPTRDDREKPDVCAPGIQVEGAKSGSGDGITVMCGTSMAAPHVTGAVALLLSRTVRRGEDLPTANQIGKALRQNTQNAAGWWNRGQGFGVLDVAGLLEAF